MKPSMPVRAMSLHPSCCGFSSKGVLQPLTATELKQTKNSGCKIQKGQFVSKNYWTHKTGVCQRTRLSGGSRWRDSHREVLLSSAAVLTEMNGEPFSRTPHLKKNKYLRGYKAQIGFSYTLHLKFETQYLQIRSDMVHAITRTHRAPRRHGTQNATPAVRWRALLQGNHRLQVP